MAEIRTLRADEIEVKIKQVTEKGAFALLYKTARTDMSILDEVFGPYNWTNDYKEIKGNLYCGIAVYMGDIHGWVWRWDCGIESREDDGNEKKGEASDAFKRAGTRWGIGRELYTAPLIFLRVPTKEINAKGKTLYILENKYTRFDVKSIGYDENRRINRIEISDDSGKTVFRYPRQSYSTETGAAKSASAVNQSSEEKRAEPSEEDKLKAALGRRIILKGMGRTLEQLPSTVLQQLAQRAKEKDLRDDMLRVMQYKFQKEQEEVGDDDLPF